MRQFVLVFMTLLSFYSHASTQLGECGPASQSRPQNIISSKSNNLNVLKVLEFQCEYYCRHPQGHEELVLANYYFLIEQAEDEFKLLRCEGEGSEKVFFSRLSQSFEVKDWANQVGVDYEGPYGGRLTQETKAMLLKVGQKLAVLKSYIPSRAGHILIEIGSDTQAGKELLESYLQELRNGSQLSLQFQGPISPALQTVEDWVLHFIALYGRHLY